MKTLLFTYLLLFISCNIKNSNVQMNEQQDVAQQDSLVTKTIVDNNSSVSVFLDCEFDGEVQMFDRSHHMIKTIKNDFENENIVMFDLQAKNDSMFYVIAYWALDKSLIAEGWIYKNNHLGIFSSAYNRDFILYEAPYDREKIVAIDKEYNPEMYEISDFEGNWLKIRAKIENILYNGWIPPEMQCSNVYSTCN